MSASSRPPFAGKVARAMRERGVSLRALCREVGMDASFFSKVLAGKRSPPVEEDVLRRIASTLALDPAELIVSAGRIPAEWRGVWADSDLFHKVHALAANAAPNGRQDLAAAAATRPLPAPAKRPEPVKAPLPRVHFGDELL